MMATSIQDDKNKENNKMYNKKDFKNQKGISAKCSSKKKGRSRLKFLTKWMKHWEKERKLELTEERK